MVVVYRSLDRNLALEWEWGGLGVGMVLKLDQLYYTLDMLKHRKPQPYKFLLIITMLHPIFHKAKPKGMGVASINRTDKFWHIGSTEEFDG
jgi:hypothetical protein